MRRPRMPGTIATVAEGAPVTLDGSGSTDPEGENSDVCLERVEWRD